MKRSSSSRSRGISGGGFKGSRSSSFGSSRGSSFSSSRNSFGRHRSYGQNRYHIFNSLPWWGKIIYVVIIIIVLVAINY